MTLLSLGTPNPEGLASAAQARIFEALPQAQSAFFAPGRVNLMGDHIDYLGGVVLPMSLTEGTVLAAEAKARRDEGGLEVWALDASEKALLSSKDLERPLGDWRRRLVAVLAALGLTPEAVPFRIAISGTLAGGGLSSSASFALVLARWLRGEGLGEAHDSWSLARILQTVERDHAGVACGLMDPLAIDLGTVDGALRLDCEQGTATPVALGFSEAVFALVHCGVGRRLDDGAYNRVRARLAAALAEEGFSADRLPPQGARVRSAPLRHVQSEQARVWAGCEALAAGDAAAFGALMDASHGSLAEDYGVSLPELDRLTALARGLPGVHGARLTGAGFGGWAQLLVELDAWPELHRTLAVEGFPKAFIATPGGAPRALPLGSSHG
jgi:galactokinase